jgi:hypothetical protein
VDLGRKLDTPRGDGVEPDPKVEAGLELISGGGAGSQLDGDMTEMMWWR